MPRLKTAFLSVALVVTSLGATSFTRSTGDVATSVIAAVDCSQGAVQAALDDADDGDTVRVPAGICAWADGVAWTNKNVRLQGAGIDQTIVDCDECVRITLMNACASPRLRRQARTRAGASAASRFAAPRQAGS